MSAPATVALYCAWCPHAAHPGKKCPECKCKGKAPLWRRILNSVGSGIGEAKFDS